MDPAAYRPPSPHSNRGEQTIQLSVAVPCYNEMEGLYELYRRLTRVCLATIGDHYEIVFVNDGSTDDSWQIITSLATEDRHIVGVDLSRNFGHQLALTAALWHCSGNRIFIIDADLQDPPELLPEMMHKMDEGFDVVYGTRQSRCGETWFKTTTATIFYRLIGLLSDVPIPTDTGDFRLISKRVADALNAMPEAHRFIRGMVPWVGFRQAAIYYNRAPRLAGSTQYSFDRMFQFALDAITSFSVRPLRVGFYLGSLMCLLAGTLIVAAIIWWAVFKPLPGWTSLVVIVLLIGGAQTFLLGLMGEYMSRVYVQVKNRPLYIVRQLTAPGLRSGETHSSTVLGGADTARESVPSRRG